MSKIKEIHSKSIQKAFDEAVEQLDKDGHYTDDFLTFFGDMAADYHITSEDYCDEMWGFFEDFNISDQAAFKLGVILGSCPLLNLYVIETSGNDCDDKFYVTATSHQQVIQTIKKVVKEFLDSVKEEGEEEDRLSGDDY
jgi:hypothetical protein